MNNQLPQVSENQEFQKLACSELDLRRKEFSGCIFKKCDFSGCALSGSAFIDCSFIDCNFSNTKVDNCSFQNVCFENSKLLGVMFSTIDTLLIGWVYKKCNINLCDFSNLDIKNSQFLECEIRESDFVGANLYSSDFSGSSMSASKFQNTNLEKTNFVGAKDYYIDPRYNKLKEARFSYPEALSLLDSFGVKVEF